MTAEQRSLWDAIRKGISGVDVLTGQMERDILNIIRSYGTGVLTMTDHRTLMTAIERVLDRVYGLSAQSALRSRMYRQVVNELDAAALDVYRRSYQQLELMVTQSRGKQAWSVIDRNIRSGSTTGNNLSTVRRAIENDLKARTRLLRSKTLDPQRRWVPKENWNTKAGYRLSDRLWKTGSRTRAQIDAQLRQMIKDGTDPVRMAKELEKHLQQSAKSRTIYRPDGTIAKRLNMTKAPRGGYGNTAARRIVRTELSRVNAAATLEASRVIPGVIGVRYMTSNRHPDADRCDSNANGHSEGLPIGVYTYDQMPQIPAHPQCLCCAAHYSAPREEVVNQIVAKYLPNG